MGGRLDTHNIGGRVTFTLTPGFLHDDDMVSNVREEITLRLGDVYLALWTREGETVEASIR